MGSWYERFVVPRIIRADMGQQELEGPRRSLLTGAKGVVLEIGCGPGYNFPFYGSIERLYALEPSAELSKDARERALKVSFPVELINASAERIPLSDASVDTAISTWTLCSVNDPRAALAEIHRVLKPHGRLLFFEHGASPHAAVRLFQSFMTTLTRPLNGNCRYDRSIDALLQDAGFVLQNVSHPKEELRPLIYNYRGAALRP